MGNLLDRHSKMLLEQYHEQLQQLEVLEQQVQQILEKMLREADPDYAKKPDVKWNFTKFLIGRDGRILRRFEPTAPLSVIEAEIEKAMR